MEPVSRFQEMMQTSEVRETGSLDISERELSFQLGYSIEKKGNANVTERETPFYDAPEESETNSNPPKKPWLSFERAGRFIQEWTPAGLVLSYIIFSVG